MHIVDDVDGKVLLMRTPIIHMKVLLIGLFAYSNDHNIISELG